jgi:rod shape determining protein RodA
MIRSLVRHIDPWLVLATLPIVGAGLITMYSFGGDNSFFLRQLTWWGISLIVMFVVSFFDIRIFKRTDVVVGLFIFASVLLAILFGFGHISKGAQSWFSFGGVSFQPADLMKLVVVLVLAKYFSRRHVEIANMKHVLISGVYAFIPFILVLLQPDFGSAMIIFLIWVGMALVAGIKKRHLAMIGGVVLIAFTIGWFFLFKPYQKERLITFVNPLHDIRGASYNVFQSTIAVGSGQILGKGVGYGTQSRLQFLPEYQTDFIFAAFAEEWGFIGSIILLLLFAFLLGRIIVMSMVGASNFEMLFGAGIAIYFIAHIIINVGMNIGVAPVTGIPLPFMSYGGSHLLVEYSALGIIMAMYRYSRTAHRDDMKNEFVGYEHYVA